MWRRKVFDRFCLRFGSEPLCFMVRKSSLLHYATLTRLWNRLAKPLLAADSPYHFWPVLMRFFFIPWPFPYSVKITVGAKENYIFANERSLRLKLRKKNDLVTHWFLGFRTSFNQGDGRPHTILPGPGAVRIQENSWRNFSKISDKKWTFEMS